jgi:hypothetical protein
MLPLCPTLLRVTAAQQTTEISLNALPTSLSVQPGATYTLVNDNGQVIEEDLVLKRKNNALELEVDGETVVTISDFYVPDNNARRGKQCLYLSGHIRRQQHDQYDGRRRSGSATDAAGNNNTIATQNIQIVDTLAPTVAITDNTAGYRQQ